MRVGRVKNTRCHRRRISEQTGDSLRVPRGPRHTRYWGPSSARRTPFTLKMQREGRNVPNNTPRSLCHSPTNPRELTTPLTSKTTEKRHPDNRLEKVRNHGAGTEQSSFVHHLLYLSQGRTEGLLNFSYFQGCTCLGLRREKDRCGDSGFVHTTPRGRESSSSRVRDVIPSGLNLEPRQ